MKDQPVDRFFKEDEGQDLVRHRIVQEIVYTAPVPGGDYQASSHSVTEEVKVEAR